MGFYGVFLGLLGVWRVTHLLHAEDGPWDLVARLRRAAGGGFFGRLLDCFYCASVWVALPFAALLATSIKEGLLLWPALSGAAILLERVTKRPLESEEAPPPAPYVEDEEDDHGLLRTEADGGSRGGGAPPGVD